MAVERFIELSNLMEANENAIKLAWTAFEFSLARGKKKFFFDMPISALGQISALKFTIFFQDCIYNLEF